MPEIDDEDDEAPKNGISGWQARANTAVIRYEANELFLEAYEKLYTAALDDGSPEMIREARRLVTEQHDRVLDHEAALKRMVFLSHGVDPEKRHKRFTVKDVRA